MRPPAVRVEKSPAWDLIGVDTDAVAMVVSDINDIPTMQQVNVSTEEVFRYIE
jgi:hypothetical protein